MLQLSGSQTKNSINEALAGLQLKLVFVPSSAEGSTPRQLKDCSEVTVGLTGQFSLSLQSKPISLFHLDFLFNFCQLEQWFQPCPGDP